MFWMYLKSLEYPIKSFKISCNKKASYCIENYILENCLFWSYEWCDMLSYILRPRLFLCYKFISDIFLSPDVCKKVILSSGILHNCLLVVQSTTFCGAKTSNGKDLVNWFALCQDPVLIILWSCVWPYKHEIPDIYASCSMFIFNLLWEFRLQ